MPVTDLLKQMEIHEGVKLFRETKGAVLIDVREPDEFADAHIPNAVNIPLGEIDSTYELYDLDTPLFVYCRTGNRSGKAKYKLEEQDFESVTNIGGIADYKGQIIRGIFKGE